MSSSGRGRIAVPVLDDRHWKDLVADARALIPKYAPQWTDHNPSDVGITLIELFAFLVEGLTYRLNRVPEKNYIAFLNLLGITRDPQTPARAFLTFTAAPGAPATVYKGAQAQTRGSEADPPIVFETDEDVKVLPTNLEVALQIDGLVPDKYVNVSKHFTAPPGDGSLVTIGPQKSVTFCLGFDEQVAEELRLSIGLTRPVQMQPPVRPSRGPRPGRVKSPPPEPQARVSWVYSQAGVEPGSWSPIRDVVDETLGLRQDGVVRFTVPADWAGQIPTGQVSAGAWSSVAASSRDDEVTDPLFWVGLRIWNQVDTPISIGLSVIRFNSASAFNALTTGTEPLGVSDGKPFQVFELARRPLFKRPDTDTPYDHVTITVDGASWTQVEELPHGAGNVYRIDPVTGEIRFGNHKSGIGHGTIPPAGSAVTAASYRYVAGGSEGNVGGGAITQLRARVERIVGVTNVSSSYGGSDEEPIDETKRRAPEVLRNRYRAVTAEDYEYLAREATTDVAIVRCLEPRIHLKDFAGKPQKWRAGDPWYFAKIDRAPGNVNLIVVPDYGAIDPRPEPSDDLVSEVSRYLDKRRPVAANLIVIGPRYVPIKATVEISIFQRAIDHELGTKSGVETETRIKLDQYLHPTRGGPGRTGWEVGQAVFIADLFRAIAPDENVGFISSLLIQPLVPLYHYPPIGSGGTWNDDADRPFRLARENKRSAVRLADYELVCSASVVAPDAHYVNASIVT